MRAIDEAADIQALVKTGFGSLDGAAYVLLRIGDPAAARRWLRGLEIASVAAIAGGKLASALQIAFTAAGLRQLGLDGATIAGFAPEFVEGLAGSERRSHRLGDAGDDAPEHWEWGHDDAEPHVLIAVFTPMAAIDDAATALAGAAITAGCTLLRINRTSDMAGREPFGFADGLSQPALDWDGAIRPGGAVDRDYRNGIAAGEVLLGHPNEYGLIAEGPTIDATTAGADRLPLAPDGKRDLGRNGSYLVYRQLAQDVRGFWRWTRATAGANAVALAETMVGRRMDGLPLPGLPLSPIAGIDDPNNAFLYRSDGEGAVCPIGSHIRRANPRSGDDPQGRHGFAADLLSSLGLTGSAGADAIASARFHRILRRGREYGDWLDPEAAAEPDAPDPMSGLHFLCLNANLARQFEFVQGAWIASAKFGGMSGEQDPLLGNRRPFPADQPTDAFSYRDKAGHPCIASGLPRFVTVKGGAYFFLPGMKALGWLLGEH